MSSKTKTPQLEELRRATGAALRAVAGVQELDAVFAAQARGKIGREVYLPSPGLELEPEAVALMRGQADKEAVKLRYHNPALHRERSPGDPAARAIFDALEQARFEAAGALRYEGVGENLQAALADECRRKNLMVAQSQDDVTMSEVLRLMAYEAMTGKPLPEQAKPALEVWRDQLPEHLTQRFDALKDSVYQQADYQRVINEILTDLSFDVDDPGDFDPDDAQDDQQDADEGEQSDQQSQGEAESQDDSASVELEAGEDQSGESDDSQQSQEQYAEDVTGGGDDEDSDASDTPPPYVPPDHNLGKDKEYQVFTTKFDEIVSADELCDADELTRLRELLDKEMEHLRGLISKIANRLQRRLMAQQQRAWHFNLEEGLLDTARLDRVIVDVTSPLSFKQESETEFRDTVVTLLIDNSGSMRGRPISTAAACADILARTLERCAVKVEILGFTTRMWKGGSSRDAWIEAGKPRNPGRLNDLRHIIYKAADAPWRRARKNLGLMLREGILKENIDGEALAWAHDRISVRPEHRKILMVISDGAPVDETTLSNNHAAYLERHLREQIDFIENRSKVELIAIGIGHDVTRYYKRAVTITQPEQLGSTMMGELLSLFDEKETRK
jgi:cobaltochelatase CobT